MWVFLLNVFLIVTCMPLLAEEKMKMEAILILNMPDQEQLPRNFRSVQSEIKALETIKLNLEGFHGLNISGSGQFSKKSLEKILAHIGKQNKVHVIDLRQESHGYLNGSAVSWYSQRNRGNFDKSINDIESFETKLLQEALNRKNITLSKVSQKDSEGINLPDVVPMPFEVVDFETEKDLTKKFNLNYVRIPVTDALRPTDEMVDYFMNFIREVSPNDWLHFHCSAGVGRTTTFMVMYDIIRNSKKVSFDEIIERQNLLGGKNLKDFGQPSCWKYPYLVEKYKFLEEFYKYIKANDEKLSKSWKQHLELGKSNQ